MALLRAQVETERPGIVTVRAKAAPGREMDARPIAGFFVRRRYEGDTFQINDWVEFSPRWMEFIDKPPDGWIEKIQEREKEQLDLMAKAEIENAKTPEQRMAEQFISMAQMASGGVVQTINQATGKVSKPKAESRAEI
jgi:hypothetical protein